MGAADDFVLQGTEPDTFEVDGRLYSVVEHGSDRPSIYTVVESHYRGGVYVHGHLRDMDMDWPTYKRVHARHAKRKAARAKLAHLDGLIAMLEKEREEVRQALVG